jgi:hypothetical protein
MLEKEQSLSHCLLGVRLDTTISGVDPKLCCRVGETFWAAQTGLRGSRQSPEHAYEHGDRKSWNDHAAECVGDDGSDLERPPCGDKDVALFYGSDSLGIANRLTDGISRQR